MFFFNYNKHYRQIDGSSNQCTRFSICMYLFWMYFVIQNLTYLCSFVLTARQTGCYLKAGGRVKRNRRALEGDAHAGGKGEIRPLNQYRAYYTTMPPSKLLIRWTSQWSRTRKSCWLNFITCFFAFLTIPVITFLYTAWLLQLSYTRRELMKMVINYKFIKDFPGN